MEIKKRVLQILSIQEKINREIKQNEIKKDESRTN